MLLLTLFQPKEKVPKDGPKAPKVKKEKGNHPIQKVSGTKANDPLAIRTIFITGLPPSVNLKVLWKKVRKVGGVETVDWPGKTSEGTEDPTTGNDCTCHARLWN